MNNRLTFPSLREASEAVKSRLGFGSQPKAWTSFDAAKRSTVRSNTPTFPSERKQQVSERTRSDLLKKYQWLADNIGIVKRLVDMTAKYSVGSGLFPKATTSDQDWNQRHDEWFDGIARLKGLDYCGELDHYRSQTTVAGNMVGEGECFVSSLRDSVGYLSKFQLIDSVKVKGSDDARNLVDGVFYKNGRVDGYNIGKSDWDSEGQRISREDTFHVRRIDKIGVQRGVTWFYAGLNSLVDSLDLTALEKASVKVHSSLAASISGKTAAAGGLTGMAQQLVGGQTASIDMLEERIAKGGMIPLLTEHEEVKLLHSSRPSSTFSGFLDWIVRDVALGFGITPEFAWDLTKAGGVGQRVVLEDADRFFKYVGDLVAENYVIPQRNRWVAQAILANKRNPLIGLPEPKDPNWATKVKIQQPARISPDRGRDAQSYIGLVSNNMMTLDDYYAGIGMDWKEALTQIAEEQKLMRELGIQTVEEPSQNAV